MNLILQLGLVTLSAFVDISRAELCFPVQFQGIVNWKASNLRAPVYREMTIHVFSDGKKFRRAWHFTDVYKGKVRDIFFQVIYYNKWGKSKTHYYVNLLTNKCHKLVDRRDTFDRLCLPADAKILGNSSLGIVGERSIDVTTYSYNIRHSTNPTILTVMNTGTNTIIPVHETSHVKRDSQFVDILYTNYTIGIQDPSIFDLPKPCYKYRHL